MAASGIKKVFLAKIIGVIGVPLAFIPGIGALLLMTCTVAATIFNVWGILEASKDHNGYQTALVFTVADLIFSIVDTFIDNNAISSVLSFCWQCNEHSRCFTISANQQRPAQGQ